MSDDPLSLDRRVRTLEERDRADAITTAVTAETVRQLTVGVQGLQEAVGALQGVVREMAAERAWRRHRQGVYRWTADAAIGLAGAAAAIIGLGLL